MWLRCTALGGPEGQLGGLRSSFLVESSMWSAGSVSSDVLQEPRLLCPPNPPPRGAAHSVLWMKEEEVGLWSIHAAGGAVPPTHSHFVVGGITAEKVSLGPELCRLGEGDVGKVSVPLHLNTSNFGWSQSHRGLERCRETPGLPRRYCLQWCF